jgi:hypothetical protein
MRIFQNGNVKMVNKIKKEMLLLLVLALCFTGIVTTQCATVVYAKDTATVSIGSASCETGDDVTITVSVTSNGGSIGVSDIWLMYDSSVIAPVSGYDAGGGGSVRLYSYSDMTFTVKFKAIGVGTSNLSVNTSNSEVIGNDLEYMSISAKTGSVTVKAPVSYSTDNTLSSLEISPGVLSPAFSPNVTSYTTTVGADCSQLVVSAVTNDSSATVSVKGTRMDPGSNTTTITVTAQDGSKKVYTIYTTKDSESTTEKATDSQTSNGSTAAETPSVDESKARKVTINNIDYTISDDLSANPLPSGYEQTDYEYNGVIVKAGKGVNTKLILMYLESSDSKGKSGFYIYDSVTRSFSAYCEVAQPDITYAVLSITDSMEKPDGYTKTSYTINGIKADALVDETGRYYLFYAVSSNGVTGWFRYDSQDGTIQLYSAKTDAEAAFNSQSDTSERTNQTDDNTWKAVSAVLAVVSVILFILLIIFAVKGSKNKRAFVAAARADKDSYEFDDDYEEDDGENIEAQEDVLEEPTEEIELFEVEEDDELR